MTYDSQCNISSVCLDCRHIGRLFPRILSCLHARVTHSIWQNQNGVTSVRSSKSSQNWQQTDFDLSNLWRARCWNKNKKIFSWQFGKNITLTLQYLPHQPACWWPFLLPWLELILTFCVSGKALPSFTLPLHCTSLIIQDKWQVCWKGLKDLNNIQLWHL